MDARGRTTANMSGNTTTKSGAMQGDARLSDHDKSAATTTSFKRWSRNLSARQNQELNRLNQIERRRQFLELEKQSDLFDQMSSSVNGPSGSLMTSLNKSSNGSGPTVAASANDGRGDGELAAQVIQDHHSNEESNQRQDSVGKSAAPVDYPSLDKQATGVRLTSVPSPEGTCTDQNKGKDEILNANRVQASEQIAGQVSSQEVGGDKIGLLASPELPLTTSSPILNGQNDSACRSVEQQNQQQQLISPDQLVQFLSARVPDNKRVLCLIVRDKMPRLNKAKSYFYPTYYLFIQAIIDINDSYCGDQMLHVASDDDLNAGETAKTSSATPLSADNSFSASSSISADMMFIGANHSNGATNSTINNKVHTGNSYSDNEVYADTETEDDASGQVDSRKTSKVSSSLISPETNPASGISRAIQKLARHKALDLAKKIADAEPRLSTEESNEDDDDSDNNELDEQQQRRRRQQRKGISFNNRLMNRDESDGNRPSAGETIEQVLFDNELNPYTGTYGVLLAGRRRKKAKTYLIGPNEHGYTRKNSICKLKSNVLGTQFTAIRVNDHRDGNDRSTIASISYEANVLGFKGPRKMRVLLAKDPSNGAKNLPEVFKKDPGSIIHLKNMTPSWNVESQSYVLNFHGRVTQASVKNFQLIECDDHLNEGQKLAAQLQQRPTSARAFGHQSHQAKQMVPLDTRDANNAGQSSQNHLPSNGSYQQQARLSDELKADSELVHSMMLNRSGGTSSGNGSTSAATAAGGDVLYSSDKSLVLAGNKSLAYNRSIVMQFGRISSHEFTCDVTYPLSILQAFSIALSSFDSKLACE